MIDSELRSSLITDLVRMLTTRTSSQEFLDRICFRYSLSDDRAVREIADRCFEVCFDGSPEQQPKQIGIANRQAREVVARSVLFLQSDHDYRWPLRGFGLCQNLIVGLGILTLLPVLMGVLFLSVPEALAISAVFSLPLSIVGVAGLLWGVYLISQPTSARPVHPEADQIHAGPWPFSNRSDLINAARKCNLVSDANRECS